MTSTAATSTEIVTGTLPELEGALAEAIERARADDRLAPVTVLVGHVLLKRYLPRMLAARGIALLNVRFVRPHELAAELAPDDERGTDAAGTGRGADARAAGGRGRGRVFRRDQRGRRVYRRAAPAVSRTRAGRIRESCRAGAGVARGGRRERREGDGARPPVRAVPGHAKERRTGGRRRAVRSGGRRAARGPAADLRVDGAGRSADAADRADRGRARRDGVLRRVGAGRGRGARGVPGATDRRGERRSAGWRAAGRRRRSGGWAGRCSGTARRPSPRATSRW